jgi:hypothetical protein
LRKHRANARERINVGRPRFAAVNAEVHQGRVIYKDDDDIRFWIIFRVRGSPHRHEDESENPEPCSAKIGGPDHIALVSAFCADATGADRARWPADAF